MIPFVDIKAQLDSMRSEIDDAIAGVLETSSYIRGPAIDLFENQFAKATGSKFVRGVGSGTDALHLAVRALNIGPGDEVITVPNTWISTAFAASYVGAKIVLVDINPETYQMDPDLLAQAITPNTKAVIPVHMYGHPAPMNEILEICQPHNIKIIEDVAHAPLAETGGRQTGTFGDIGCYSFYPSKNLGCYGDGGAVITNDPELKKRIDLLSNYGQSAPHNHKIIGFNSRLDSMQAAVLNAKLPFLQEWNKKRRDIARQYGERLKSLPVQPLIEADNVLNVYHLYIIQVEERDACLKYLRDNGIMAQIHFPLPLHLQDCYAGLGYKKGDFPVTEAAAQRILSLPIYPELSLSQINKVCDTLSAFFTQK